MSGSDAERTAPEGAHAEPEEQPAATETIAVRPAEAATDTATETPPTAPAAETNTEPATNTAPAPVAEASTTEESTASAATDSPEMAARVVEETTAPDAAPVAEASTGEAAAPVEETAAETTAPVATDTTGNAFASPRELITVRAGTGKAFTVKEGGRFQIVDEAGKQVCALVAFRQADRSEWASVSHTRENLGSIVLTLNGTIVSNRRSWMLRLEEDTVGRHDLTMPACDGKRYLFHYGLTDHPNCRDNLTTALNEYDIPSNALPDPINLFMHVAILRRGELEVREPLSEPGDYVVLRALTDVIIAVSACPQDQDATNGRTPTDLTIRVFDA
ncbi:MAG TPA: DUF1989 domain-containing protein [Thermomicrobiales bacterium]|nr:DUF1989 domain-containing protein [Thermomicrobiales bacterium]